jgi:hypothetical protein
MLARNEQDITDPHLTIHELHERRIQITLAQQAPKIVN